MPKGRAAVHSVEFEGTDQIDSGELQEMIATQPSSRFLGLFPGVVYDYSIYNRYTLERDLERIERFYRARGFYQARARAGLVRHSSDTQADVTIEVQEGLPSLVGSVEIRGIESLPARVVKAVRLAAQPLAIGTPFREDVYVQVEQGIHRALTDAGYAWASVQRGARVDIPRHVVGVWFDVKAGPQAYVGEVTIVGEKPLNEEVIRRAVDLKPGERYSTQDIADARDAVLNLGVFSNVVIEPQLGEGPSKDLRVPLRVQVTKMKLRALQLGAGFELDVIRTDVHLRARWEHRNFFGDYRHFVAEVRPGLVFYPTRLPGLDAPTNYLPEVKSRLELRQPGFLEARTFGALRTEFSIYPVLLTPDIDPDASVLGYRELLLAVGLERPYRRLFGSLYYNLQFNTPFTYIGLLDPALTGVLISYVSLRTSVDLRNDSINPHKGLFLGTDFEFAGLGGDALDLKIKPEVRGYIPIGRKPTLALRFGLGFVFPFNYGESLLDNATFGRPPEGMPRDEWVKDVQLVYFRGLFSGGTNSNRGYPYRGVSPHGVIPFFTPTVAAEALAQGCEPSAADATSSRCNQPLGGFTLWEGSAEVRFPISGPFSGATFCDMSDVSPKKIDLRFRYLHLSCGVGARYDTAVGAIRFDAGYRIPGMQVIGGADDEIEGNAGTFFGLPLTISLGIGEAY